MVILSQYVAFTQVCKEQVALHGRTQKAVEEIVRICQTTDILAEYMKSREKEVKDIMFTLYDLMSKENFFIPMEIWEKTSRNMLVCYDLFQRVSDGFYAVQSKNFYRKEDFEIFHKKFLKQRFELFIDIDIEEREMFFKTIQEAINNFNKDFE